MNKNLNFIFKKKKTNKIILYFLLFIVIVFFTYFSIPKFLNYTPELIKKSLKKNSKFNIKNISNTNYKFFPTPRLRVYGSNLEHEENILKIEGAEIDIILNLLGLIDYKRLNYDRLLIRGGTTNVKINKVNKLLDYIKKNQKKIKFKKNNIVILKENKKIFEIKNSITKLDSQKKNKQQLRANGFFLNHKIYFLIENNPNNKSDISFGIPALDISANIQLNNKDNFSILEGLVNLEILNNFFKFNFIKEKKLKINQGFVRSNLVNSSFEGEIYFKPNFSFNLNIKPSDINIKKILFIIQQKYFLDNQLELEIIKKINGSLNFKNIFEGSIIFKNGEIIFQNFKTKKDNSIFFDAKISKFGKNEKIQFNLLKNIQHKNKSKRELRMSGFIIPSTSRVIFKKILLDNEIFTDEKTKKYEKKFKKEVINNSLSNLFIDSKINNFIIDLVD
jgi:hypothetical protein